MTNRPDLCLLMVAQLWGTRYLFLSLGFPHLYNGINVACSEYSFGISCYFIVRYVQSWKNKVSFWLFFALLFIVRGKFSYVTIILFVFPLSSLALKHFVSNA